jgi:aminoglycoside phosphotransferase (APT) family kinase protein
MLAPADAAFAARDSQLPGLATALDAEAMVAAIRAARPDCGIDSARVNYVKYKPRTKCLVGYELRLANRVVPAYAKIYPRSAAHHLRDAAAARSADRGLGPGRIALESCLALLSVFPDDQQIVALRRLADPDKRRRVLRNTGLRFKRGTDTEFQTLVYKPERRAVARVDIAGAAPLVVKAYSHIEFTRCHGTSRTFSSRGDCRVPRPVAHSTYEAVAVLEWLDGRVLSEALVDEAVDAAQLAAVGRALAALHEQPPESLDPMTNVRLAEMVRAEASVLGTICPLLAIRAGVLAESLAVRLEKHPSVYRSLHGDFHARQVLLGDGPVGILDFDGAVSGDPLIDLGTFVAHLECDALRKRLPEARVRALTEALLDGYQQATGSTISSARLAAMTAGGVLRLAPECFRYRDPEWPDRIDALITRAEQLAATPVASARCHLPRPAEFVPVEDPFGVAADTRLPLVRSALDPEAVYVVFSSRLRKLAGDTGAVRPLSIRATRHTPGRRSVIEYDVEVCKPPRAAERITLVGKARARGADTGTFAVVEALWNAGFDSESADSVSVPQPIGIVPEFGMWVQRKVAGIPATMLVDGAESDALGARIADAIHRVHRAGIETSRHHTRADELRLLDARFTALSQREPRWRRRLERLYNACVHAAGSIEATGRTGIHRDFHPDQVLVDGARLWLLDFDLYCLGDPALDVGNFIGHIRELAVRTRANPDALFACESAIEDQFGRLAGARAVAAARVYATLTLARHVSLSTELPGRAAATIPLLTLCEERLGITVRRPHL